MIMDQEIDIQVETQDWETILRRGFESKELDYKGPCAWAEDDKVACCRLVKDILAIANTKGGWLVIGVNETSTGFSWDGLTDDQCKSFETSRLNRFLQNYADPPINTGMIKPRSQEKNFVIITIPRFPDTPHICKKDFQENNNKRVLAAGAIYVRTDNNESASIKNSADMRAIIEQATRNRADQLLSSFRAILTGVPSSLAGDESLDHFFTQANDAKKHAQELIPRDLLSMPFGYRETIIHPMKFERFQFTIQQIERMAEAACVSYRGWPYIFYPTNGVGVQSLEDGLEFPFQDPDAFQFWQLRQSGLLYLNEMFQEDEQIINSRHHQKVDWEKLDDGCFPEQSKIGKLFGAITFAYTCVESVQCLVNLYTGQLADHEIIRLQIHLSGLNGRHLAKVRGNNNFHPMPWCCKTESIISEQRHSLAEWRAGVIPHAFEIFKYVMEKFNAPEPSYDEIASQMQKLLSRQL
jgi:hypothetical protein